jgi:hypothetical protein
MRNEWSNRILLGTAALGLLTLTLACGGTSPKSTGTTTLPAPQGTVAVSVSDASTEDWAQIGVRILGITLTPQGGGTPVTVYTAPATPPMLNLVQLDQLGELIGKLAVPAGTYAKATLTVSANPGDVTLVASSNPSAGFDLAPGTVVDPGDIQIKNPTGAPGSLVKDIAVDLASPLVVVAGGISTLDLEFNLSHPAFLVDRVPAGASTPVWAVNFNGPVRHRPNYELAGTLLRQAYGAVSAVAADSSSITIVKNHEVYPVPASGPAPIAGLQALTILPDATNGTLFYDEDAQAAPVVIKNFSAQAGTLKGKYVRLALRYQADGSLVAVRVWAGSSWGSVWLSPEGHVRHVDAANKALYVDNENGVQVPIAVNEATAFFFRTPASALADATPIGTGTAFLSNLVRGFKVHVGLVDPLAATLTAKTVDIEIAKYEGVISGATATQFTYTRNFAGTADDYTATLPFCAATTKNGKDSSGAQILGFKWWNYSFPTLPETGPGAVADFIATVNGSANFGGAFGAVKASGTSYAVWGDPANAAGWSTKWAVLDPSTLPKGSVASPWVPAAKGGTFGMILPKGPNAVTVSLSSVTGSATLVYDVSTVGRIVTVTPVDITTQAGQASLATAIANGTQVKVDGIPQPDGTIKAYAVTYYH